MAFGGGVGLDVDVEESRPSPPEPLPESPEPLPEFDPLVVVDGGELGGCELAGCELGDEGAVGVAVCEARAVAV